MVFLFGRQISRLQCLGTSSLKKLAFITQQCWLVSVSLRTKILNLFCQKLISNALLVIIFLGETILIHPKADVAASDLSGEAILFYNFHFY